MSPFATVPVGLLRGILPEWVVVVQTHEDADEDQLFDVERALISNAVPKRRAEFSTVRACARLALAEMGLAAAPILPGERGAPGWPDGVLGSMTHCLGFRAAVLARSEHGVGVGVDAEPHAALPDGVLGLVARPEEVELLQQLTGRHPTVHWDRLLFSMKEAVYKTWFPLTRAWLDFDQASISIDAGARTFAARLLVPGPVTNGVAIAEFTGRFAVEDELVLTAIAIAA